MKKQLDNVMLDFETLGVGPRAPIAQIGAVYFDNNFVTIDTRTLDVNIKLYDSSTCPVKVEPSYSTIDFWLKQPKETIEDVFEDSGETDNDLFKIFNLLNIFLKDVDYIYCHTSFDQVLLTYYLQQLGIKPNFKYTQFMDIRTIYRLCDFDYKNHPREINNTYHTALGDCIHQISCLKAAMTKLKGK